MKVTKEDIINFNELYLKLKTYAAVARQTGFSASTVSKYIIKGYIPQSEIRTKSFTLEDLPAEVIYENVNNEWLIFDAEEIEGIQELWEEMLL